MKMSAAVRRALLPAVRGHNRSSGVSEAANAVICQLLENRQARDITTKLRSGETWNWSTRRSLMGSVDLHPIASGGIQAGLQNPSRQVQAAATEADRRPPPREPRRAQSTQYNKACSSSSE